MYSANNVNAYIPYTVVCEAIDIDDQDAMLGRMPCPFCGLTKVRAMPDPKGGYRYHCLHCLMHCDSVQLYSAVKSTDLASSLKALSARVSLPEPVTKATATEYAAHVKEVARVSGAIDGSCNDLLVKQHNNCIASLIAMHCWFSRDREIIRRTIGRGIINVSRQKLGNVATLEMLPRYWRFPCLGIPTYDMLDRPQSLYAVGLDGLPIRVGVDIAGDTIDEDGFAFLPDLPVDAPVVYAVRDIITAAQIRCRGLRDSLAFPPIVGWTDATGAAWNALHQQTIIIWSSEVTPTVFKNAIRTGAMVSIQPVSGPSVAKWLCSMPMLRWQALVDQAASKWPEALCKWLLVASTESAVAMLKALELGQVETDAVLASAATSFERRRIATLLGVCDAAASITYGNDVIEQEDNKWVMVKRTAVGETRSILCDGIIKVERLNTLPDDTFWAVGTFVRDNEVTTFEVPYNELKRDAVKCLNERLAADGKPLIWVLPNWGNKLLDIARAFYNPPVKPKIGAFRSSPEGDSISFPNFRLTDGRIDEVLGVEGQIKSCIPGQNLQAPSIVELRPGDVESSDSSNVAMALSAMVLHNLAATTTQQRPRSIVIKSPKDNAGVYVAEQFAQIMDMPICRNPTDQELLMAHADSSSWPYVVDVRNSGDKKCRRIVFESAPSSLIAIAPSLAAWSELGVAGWCVIDGSGLVSEYDVRQARDAFWYALSRMQYNGYIRDAGTSPSRCLKLFIDILRLPRDEAKRVNDRVKGDMDALVSPAIRSLLPVVYANSKMPNVFIKTADDEGVRISVNKLNEWLVENDMIAIQPAALSARLMSEKLLAGERWHKKRTTLTIASSAWLDANKQWRRSMSLAF